MRRPTCLLLLIGAASAKEIVVRFPNRGVAYPTGTITLSQDSAAGALTITTALSRLENSAQGNKWHGRPPPPTTNHPVYGSLALSLPHT